jgi:hypothetical protein
MAYSLSLTNGNYLADLTDNTYDGPNSSTGQHTDLYLIGKNYQGYGTFLNENFIRLLENFANSFTSPPQHPLVGQLWWDTSNNILRVYTGNTNSGGSIAGWKISTGATAQGTAPTDVSNLGGDLWYDNVRNKFYVYAGKDQNGQPKWTFIGPGALSLDNTGVVSATMTDTSQQSHTVLQFLVGGVIVAIYSTATFTPITTSGFSTIVAGFNLSSLYPTLNTQSITATGNLLVQRDNAGKIFSVGLDAGTGTVSASTVSATTVSSTTISGSLTGNVTTGTGGFVSAGTITATGGVTGATLTGTIQTPDQSKISNIGTLAQLNVYGTTTLSGTATLNGLAIATLGGSGSASFSSINNTVIGNVTPSSGAFTYVEVGANVKPTGNNTAYLGTNPGGWWNTVYTSTANSVTINTATVNTGTVAAAGDISSSGGNVSANYGIFNNIKIGGTGGSLALQDLTISNSLTPTSNTSVNLGDTTHWWNNIYGTAIHALYADLAERFHADAEYPTGTVVELGGSAEITQAIEELSDKVLGVISTSAAYLMNSGAGTDITHPAVAIGGRVPVRVTGTVAKGDRLVSAGNGVARSGQPKELTAWNVIGRSLEDKDTSGPGIIEAIVKINL